MSFIFSILMFSFLALQASADPLIVVPVGLNWKAEPQFGGFYAASITGVEKKYGVHIEARPGGAGTPVVQMVAAGTLNMGIASADEVIIARSHGADVIALFAAFQTNPQAIMTHEERGFQKLSDVYAAKGPLAIQKGLPYALYLANKFAKHTKAQIVPYIGGIENFLADKTYSQQCFATSEPLAAAKKKQKVKTFLVADEGYNPYTTVLVVNGAFLRANGKVVRSVVASVREGWAEYLKNPKIVNATMRTLNDSMDEETFSSGADAQKSLIQLKDVQLGTMTSARWQTLRQQLIDLKLVAPKEAKTDVNSYFQNL